MTRRQFAYYVEYVLNNEDQDRCHTGPGVHHRVYDGLKDRRLTRLGSTPRPDGAPCPLGFVAHLMGEMGGAKAVLRWVDDPGHVHCLLVGAPDLTDRAGSWATSHLVHEAVGSAAIDMFETRVARPFTEEMGLSVLLETDLPSAP